MTKKQKQQTTAIAALLLLLLGWRLASAKTKPAAKVTVGPITVEAVTEEDPEQARREERARYRNRVLDLVGFDEDAWAPTRRPTTADNLVIASIFTELARLDASIPDPDGFDESYDREELTELVTSSRQLDPSTSSRPAVAFGSSRYMSRRLDIEKAVQDMVAMAEDGPRRRPSNVEATVALQMIGEYDALGQKLLAIDSEADLGTIPLATLLDAARTLPTSTTALPAVATARLNSEPGVTYT